MGWYITRRLAAALVTVWIVATAGFLLVEIIPGDPARQLAGPGASAQSLAAIREAYGFDDPLPVRYVDSLVRMAQGDLGYSFAKAEPVMDALLRSLPWSLHLRVEFKEALGKKFAGSSGLDGLPSRRSLQFLYARPASEALRCLQ